MKSQDLLSLKKKVVRKLSAAVVIITLRVKIRVPCRGIAIESLQQMVLGTRVSGCLI